MPSFCTYCGAKGEGITPAGHVWGRPCPHRDQPEVSVAEFSKRIKRPVLTLIRGGKS